MITIDIIHEYEAKTEKPHERRSNWLVDTHKPIDPVYLLAHERQNTLLRVAQETRFVNQITSKPTEQPKENLQPHSEQSVPTKTVFERYARIVLRLAHKISVL